MRLDVVFGGHGLQPSDVTGRVVAVIDVLRASTSIALSDVSGKKSLRGAPSCSPLGRQHFLKSAS